MVAQKGSLMLIKIGDGQPTEQFATVGGLRISSMTLNHAVMDASCVGGGPWRQLLEGAGPCAMRLEGVGIFTDSAAEANLQACVFAGTVRNFRLYSGNGDYVQGPFMVSMYSRSGHVDSEEGYMMRLDSAGDIQMVAG